MKKIKLILTFLAILNLTTAQEKADVNIWDLLLNDVKVRYRYSLKYNSYIPKPRFGEKLEAFDGTYVTVRGYFLAADVTGSVFVLSYYPMNMCFFCSAAGIETIIELNPDPDHIQRFKRLRTDNYFEVKGKLKLNADDYYRLIYILEDAEFVRTIK